MILVGYDGNSNNYRLLDPKTKRIKISRNVLFNKSKGWSNKEVAIINLNQQESNLKINQDLIEKGKEILQEQLNQNEFKSENESELRHSYNLRPRGGLRHPERYITDNAYEAIALCAKLKIPQTYEEATESPKADKWNGAIKEELDALIKNNT